MTMRKCRWCAAIAAVLLAAGCGGGAPESAGTTGEAAALAKEQVRKTLPDSEAMKGWKQSSRPTAVETDKLHRSQACPVKGDAGCENARFYGTSTFKREDPSASVTFQIIAYGSEQAAQDAYDVLWDGYYGNGAGSTGRQAQTLGLGPIGDEPSAALGD